MSRIPRAQRSAKSRASQIKACYVCKQEHPEDPTNHRMVEHEHQGRRCLGGDIPFARHGEPAMGKLYIYAFPQVPMANRARALQLADGRYDAEVIAQVVAQQPAGCDPHPLWWLEQFMMAAQRRRLDEEVAQMQRRPRLVERRAT